MHEQAQLLVAAQQVLCGTLDSSIQPQPEAHLSLPQRQSAYSHTCAYGKTLLQLSEAIKLHILNGRKADDADGQFTCRTAQGSSVVKYQIRPRTRTTEAQSLLRRSDLTPLSLGYTGVLLNISSIIFQCTSVTMLPCISSQSQSCIAQAAL